MEIHFSHIRMHIWQIYITLTVSNRIVLLLRTKNQHMFPLYEWNLNEWQRLWHIMSVILSIKYVDYTNTAKNIFFFRKLLFLMRFCKNVEWKIQKKIRIRSFLFTNHLNKNPPFYFRVVLNAIFKLITFKLFTALWNIVQLSNTQTIRHWLRQGKKPRNLVSYFICVWFFAASLSHCGHKAQMHCD